MGNFLCIWLGWFCGSSSSSLTDATPSPITASPITWSPVLDPTSSPIIAATTASPVAAMEEQCISLTLKGWFFFVYVACGGNDGELPNVHSGSCYSCPYNLDCGGNYNGLESMTKLCCDDEPGTSLSVQFHVDSSDGTWQLAASGTDVSSIDPVSNCVSDLDTMFCNTTSAGGADSGQFTYYFN